MAFFKDKNFLLFGLLAVLFLAIPLTVYLVQRQQQTKSTAAATTVLSFSPATATVATGATTSLDIMLDPAQNQVSFVKLVVTFDPSKLTPATGSTCSDSICPNSSVFSSVLEGPTVSGGTISITMSVGADPTKVIQSKTKIATVTFTGAAQTASTPVGIDTTQSQVLSIATSDQPSENVLQSASGATITVGQGVTPTGTPGTPGPTGATTNPVCTGLSVDRNPSGPAPFALTFTINGNSTTSTISKVTFNFGDGPVSDVTTGSGIGTKTVSVPMAHKYNNPGTFTASGVLTDANGNISTAATGCTQSVSVLAVQLSPGVTLTPGPTATATPTFTPTPTPSPTPTPTPTPRPVVPATGPGDSIVGVGLAGTVLTIFGALIFLAL